MLFTNITLPCLQVGNPRTLVSLALFCATATAAASVQAIDLSAETVVETQYQEEPDYDHAFLRVEVAPTLMFNKHWSVDGVLVLEPMDEENLHWRKRTVDHEGVFAEELKLNYELDLESGELALFAGKFNPAFGTAWEAHGIWGEDFAEDYEITEKLGVGAAYTWQTAELGRHTLTGSTFYSDTSALSRSWFTKRGRTEKEDGGAGNTEDFSSYAIALDGEDLAGIAGLNYHLAHRFQEHGDADAGSDDENGYAAAVNYAYAFNQRVSVNVMLERAVINNFDGAADDYTYNSSSVTAILDRRWNLVLGYTERVIDVDGGKSVDDHLIQFSGGYDFGNGLSVDAGWRFVEEEHHDHHTFGLMARYVFDL